MDHCLRAPDRGPRIAAYVWSERGRLNPRRPASSIRLDPVEEASRWRTRWSPPDGFDVWSAVRARGWQADLRPLRAPDGGIEACTIPSALYGFRFMVDDRVAGQLGPGRGEQSEVARFRLAHEVGHTLFFRPGTPPSRRVPPTEDEERFCDDFATALLQGAG